MSRLKSVGFCLALISCCLVIVRAQTQQSLTLISNVNIAYTYGSSSTQFVIISPLGNGISVTNAWLGIGFNSQTKMGGASVVMCLNGGNSKTVQHYYNTGYSTALLDSSNPTIGLSATSVTVDANNNLICKFTRDNSNANANYFNVNSASPYILAAYGTFSNTGGQTVTGGTPSRHATTGISSNPVSFGAQTSTTTTTTGATKLPGIYYGSFAAQGYLLSWVDTPSYTDFKLSSPQLTSGRKRRDVVSGLSNVYISFALSTDNEMGNDDVIACKVSGNIGTVERYYNPNSGAPVYMDSTNPTLGLSNATISSSNSVLYCSFRRAKATNGLSQYFDLNNNYYILMAQGAVQSSALVYHGTSRFSSSSPINFQANLNSTGSGAKNMDKAKAHGALMVFAWMLFASTGILFARYYRFLGGEILKKPVWFQVHRALMLSVPVISIVSFLVILADVQWKWISQSISLNFAHSIIGIITIGLSVIQVIIAFFRPHPNTPRRPLFNYFHRSVGISAFVLSIFFQVVSIFLGVCMSRMNMGQSGWGIMIGWTIWVIVLPILLEIVQVLFTTTKTHTETYHINESKELKSVDNTEKNKKFIESVKKLFIPFHLVAAVAFTVALIVMIALAKPANTA